MRKANWGAASGPRVGAQSCTGCAQRMRGGLARPGWPHWLHGDRREEASRRGAVEGQRWPERRASLSPAVGTAPPGLRSGRTVAPRTPCPWPHRVPGQPPGKPSAGGAGEPSDGSPSFLAVFLPRVPRGGQGRRNEAVAAVAPGPVALVGAVTFMQVCIPC